MECSVQGCAASRVGQGLCATHRARMKKHGTTDRVLPPGGQIGPAACPKCGGERERMGQGTKNARWRCRPCIKRAAAERYRSNPEPFKEYQRKRTADPVLRARAVDRTRHYNHKITPEGYLALRSTQGEQCAICGCDLRALAPKHVHIDHDHACCPGQRSCGECVRGILCHHCNVGIGALRDDPAVLRAALAYLEGRV